MGPSLFGSDFGSGFQIEGRENWVVLAPNDENRMTKTTKPMDMWFWMMAMADLTVFVPLYFETLTEHDIRKERGEQG
jgi:hypothetical protein